MQISLHPGHHNYIGGEWLSENEMCSTVARKKEG
jgi:hypothetical protein